MKRKIILIAGEDGYDEAAHIPHFVISESYGKGIYAAGGIPVLALDFRTIREYVELADGLLLTQGPIIHLARYGQIFESSRELEGFVASRDSMDFLLCKAFLDAGKPVMGIGRGAKVIHLVASEEQKRLTVGIRCENEKLETAEYYQKFMDLCVKEEER